MIDELGKAPNPTPFLLTLIHDVSLMENKRWDNGVQEIPNEREYLWVIYQHYQSDIVTDPPFTFFTMMDIRLGDNPTYTQLMQWWHQMQGGTMH